MVHVKIAFKILGLCNNQKSTGKLNKKFFTQNAL